jgi:hypothetical protein
MLKFMFLGCFFKFLRFMLFEFMRSEVRITNLTIKKKEKIFNILK